jgi:putative acyl-CoA dehydrogenase
MALHVEAATAGVMRLCRAFDQMAADPQEAARMRLLTPAIKYWVCKTAPGFLYEALECLGGNGYVEDGILARHYREAPVNAVWEGSGNVMCLDVLRAFAREGEAAIALLQSLAAQARGLPGVQAALDQLSRALATPDAEAHSRVIIELLAQLTALAALTETAPDVADIYARTRFGRGQVGMPGAIALDAATAGAIVDRALPA